MLGYVPVTLSFNLGHFEKCDRHERSIITISYCVYLMGSNWFILGMLVYNS